MNPLATKKSLLNILGKFQHSRIAVIGDIMLDHFIRGNVSRISPEAPVPVVNITAEALRLGGAGNVVYNLNALGSTVYASGVVGSDEMGKKILHQFRSLALDTSGLVVSAERPTTVKTRIIANNQQVVRFDRETISPLNSNHRQKILRYLRRCLPNIDAIIISDYGKNIVSRDLMEKTLTLSRKNSIPVIVDPKVKNIDLYKGVTIITPNQKEASEATGITITSDHDALEAAVRLRERLGCDSVLITRGEHGMTLLDKNGSCTNIPTLATEVYDVTGAGDTVISALTLAFTAGASLTVSALIANIAAGIVIRKLGTAAVRIDELKKAIQRQNNLISE